MGVPTRKKKRRLSESKESGKSQSPQDAKKVKVSEPTTTENTPTTTTSTSPVTTPTTETSSPTIAFSFYKDTQLEPKEEVKDEPNDATNEKVEDEIEDNNKVIEEKSSPKEEIKEEMPFAEPDSMPREVKGILVYHRGREKREKRIKWRPDSNLVEVEYFEVDETERVNVNKLKFENLREFESKMEKAALKSKGSISDEES